MCGAVLPVDHASESSTTVAFSTDRYRPGRSPSPKILGRRRDTPRPMPAGKDPLQESKLAKKAFKCR